LTTRGIMARDPPGTLNMTLILFGNLNTGIVNQRQDGRYLSYYL
jgi:hypothetical protein